MQTDFTRESNEKALKNFKNIKKCIKGLYQILDTCLVEDQFYYKAGRDNISKLYQNLTQLFFNDYGLRHLIKKIKEKEIELEIDLNKITPKIKQKEIKKERS